MRASKVGSPVKKCWTCFQHKPLSDFWLSKRAKDGHMCYCIACAKKREKAYRVNNGKKKHEPPAQKKCSRCKEVKPREAFSISRSSATGLDYICRVCKSAHNAVYDPLRGSQRDKNLWQRFRMVQANYLALLEAQGGKCAICEAVPASENSLCIDHCHDSGQVRGLLCNKCNASLSGMEREGFMEKALAYLARQRDERYDFWAIPNSTYQQFVRQSIRR